jgi:spore coat polysaccharide biosynthesis protein SpsF
LTVRSESSRLREKCFLPFGSKNILSHVVDRAKYFNIHPIICTSTSSADNRIEEFCISNRVDFYRGSLNNKLIRWLDCANHFNLSDFHTIDVDDPFFDPNQVFESLDMLRNLRADIIFPTLISSSGSASVGYSISTKYLSKIKAKFLNLDSLEMVDSIFNKYNFSNNYVLNSDFIEIENARLTLDYIEDYVFLDTILQICGHYCSRLEIKKALNENPELKGINWFRNIEWAKNQNDIRTKQVLKRSR